MGPRSAVDREFVHIYFCFLSFRVAFSWFFSCCFRVSSSFSLPAAPPHWAPQSPREGWMGFGSWSSTRSPWLAERWRYRSYIRRRPKDQNQKYPEEGYWPLLCLNSAAAAGSHRCNVWSSIRVCQANVLHWLRHIFYYVAQGCANLAPACANLAPRCAKLAPRCSILGHLGSILSPQRLPWPPQN